MRQRENSDFKGASEQRKGSLLAKLEVPVEKCQEEWDASESDTVEETQRGKGRDGGKLYHWSNGQKLKKMHRTAETWAR